jgi:hypothetical protein
MFLPVFCCLSGFVGVSGPINDIVLGVVNDEITSAKDCFDPALKVVEIVDFDCKLYKASCRFISDFDQGVAELVRFLSNIFPQFSLYFLDRSTTTVLKKLMMTQSEQR